MPLCPVQVLAALPVTASTLSTTGLARPTPHSGLPPEGLGSSLPERPCGSALANSVVFSALARCCSTTV